MRPRSRIGYDMLLQLILPYFTTPDAWWEFASCGSCSLCWHQWDGTGGNPRPILSSGWDIMHSDWFGQWFSTVKSHLYLILWKSWLENTSSQIVILIRGTLLSWLKTRHAKHGEELPCESWSEESYDMGTPVSLLPSEGQRKAPSLFTSRASYSSWWASSTGEGTDHKATSTSCRKNPKLTLAAAISSSLPSLVEAPH